jgi:hypothetical protein
MGLQKTHRFTAKTLHYAESSILSSDVTSCHIPNSSSNAAAAHHSAEHAVQLPSGAYLAG